LFGRVEGPPRVVRPDVDDNHRGFQNVEESILYSPKDVLDSVGADPEIRRSVEPELAIEHASVPGQCPLKSDRVAKEDQLRLTAFGDCDMLSMLTEEALVGLPVQRQLDCRDICGLSIVWIRDAGRGNQKQQK
jgi:hypothetical protein